MSKITLTNLVNLQNETTAVNAINANNAALTTALEKTLSRDGTSPNTMTAALDMNSQQIVNLPSPVSQDSALRLRDLNSFIGGGTITTFPAGGSTGQPLVKSSNTDYSVSWGDSIRVSVINNGAGSLILPTSSDTVVGRATTDTLTNKTLTAPVLTTPTLGVATATSINKVALTAPATAATLTIANNKTLTANNTLTLAGTDSTTLTFQGTDTYVGRTTTDTLTNKTLTSPSITTPTITNPAIVGTTTNDSAASGNWGEYVEGVIASGSAVSLSTATAKTVTSISLTAGDWDVDGIVYILPGATTNFTAFSSSLGTATNTFDTTAGKFYQNIVAAYVPAIGQIACPIPPYRISIAGTTNVFLIAQATFTVSTATAYGIVRARRVR